MRFISMIQIHISPSYLRIALLAGSIVVWALTGIAGEDPGCC
jgi:hypothetical protein